MAEDLSGGPHRFRFGAAYLAIAVIVGAAVGSFIVLVGRTGPNAAGDWSAWEPSGDVITREHQIAERVAERYRLPTGEQAVGVIVSPPVVQNVAIAAIAVRPSAADKKVSITDGKGSLIYSLCGFGTRCAIDTGKPTQARGRLLRREALELALYTFKYVGGVNSVVAFMPPRTGKQPAYALYLRKSDLHPQLDRPLADTLAPIGTLVPNVIRPSETVTIDKLTVPRLFKFQFQQSQQGGAVLVLAPAL